MSHRLYAFIRSNILGLVAVFIALGGTATALEGHNTVRSDDIVNGQVKTADLEDGAVTSPKLASGAVDGSKVASDSLTGQQIDESTLSTKTLQARVTQGCAAGQAMTSVGEAGDVQCGSTDGGQPGGSAGGDLTGTYPNPALADGVVTPAKIGTIPAVRLWNSSDESIPPSPGVGVTPISFDTEKYDTANMHSAANPERIVAPISGIYDVSANVIWNGPANVGTATGIVYIQLYKNGGSIVASAEADQGGGNAQTNFDTQVKLSAGDYVDLRGGNNNTANQAVEAFGDMPELSMRWVAPAP